LKKSILWCPVRKTSNYTGITYDDNGGKVNTCWKDSKETIVSSILAIRGEYYESAVHAVSLFVSQ